MLTVVMLTNLTSASYANCLEDLICEESQHEKFVDQHDQRNQNDHGQQSSCDCCATCSGHHHHSHIAFVNSKADPIMASSQSLHSSHGDTYLSQLNYPPSKPPKA